MTSTQHLGLEIDLLEKKKTAIESDLRYKARQYNGNMPCEPGLEDEDTAFLILMSLAQVRHGSVDFSFFRPGKESKVRACNGGF